MARCWAQRMLSLLFLLTITLVVGVAASPTCTLDAASCTLLSAVYDFSASSAGGALPWSSGTPSCQWQGVQCRTVNNGDVFNGLNLDSAGLSGPVPSTVWNAMAAVLQSLLGCPGCRMSIVNNNCSGAVPSNIITNCTVALNSNGAPICNFGNNPYLLLPIDDYFGYRNWGWQIYAQGNDNLMGMPFTPGNFSNAVALWSSLWSSTISNIRIAGGLYSAFGGTIPSALTGMTALTSILLDSLVLSGTLPDLSGMTSLQQMSFRNMPNINGPFPDAICNMPQLRYLDLTGIPITGTVPSCLGNMMQNGPLRVLLLPSTALTGTLPPLVATLCSYAFFGYSCNFAGSQLSLGSSNSSSAIDPVSLQASIASLNASLTSALDGNDPTSLQASMASLNASLTSSLVAIDPTSLQASIASLNASLTSALVALAALDSSQRALQVAAASIIVPLPYVLPAGLAANVAYAILSSAVVQGFNSPADFIAAAQRAFEAGIATQLSIAASSVNVTGVDRMLSGIVVTFTVSSPTLASATALKSSIVAVNTTAVAAIITAATNITVYVGSISLLTDPGVVLPPATAINVTGINVTAATAVLNSQLTSLVSGNDTGAFSLAQESLLRNLVLTSDANLSAADAGATASLVLAVLTANTTVQLTPAVQIQALAALQNVAGSIDYLGTSSAGSNVLSALSAIASSAVAQGTASNGASAVALAAMSQVQVSILGSLSNATASNNTQQQVTSATASKTAALVLAVLNVAPSVPLSPAVQTQALVALENIASVPLNLTADAGGNVVGALSVVATSAISRQASGAAASSIALATVSHVLDSLTKRQTVALLGGFGASQPLPPPLAFSTPVIQSLLSVDTALPTAMIAVNGSASRFDPLPADVLAANATAAGVVTYFRSLAFDPYGDTGTNGSTRLAFADANGTEFVIANLSAPIRFELPSLAALADGSRAQCQFWDPVALAYSTRGCTGIPDPQPPAHLFSWVDNFNASSDADMMRAWQVTGPLTAGCAAVVLDCSLEHPGVIYPNLSAPFVTPRLECNSTLSTAPKLVFTGSRCALIKPGNAYNCAWDNSAQAFTGSGCVASGGPVRCACRHLTDFACASKPTIPTASLQDLLSLSPTDIVSKLKMLFQVVIILFCLMNLGAAVVFKLDSRERRNFLQRLLSPEVGFRVTPAGAWLWRFSLSPLRSELDAPSGSAIALSALLGIPMVRLRAALPDELLVWDLASTLGRKHVCSVSGFNNSLLTLKNLLPALVSSSRGNIAASPFDGGMQKGTDAMWPSASPGLTDNDALDSHPLDKHRPVHRIVSSRAETMEEFVGSALVLAFIQVAQLMPVCVLAAHVSAASVHFSGVTTPGAERDFESFRKDCVTMLSPGILNLERRWLQRARLFKLILSQHADGSWDASSTTAFALEARPSSETKRLPRDLGSRLRGALFGMAAAAEETEDGDHENALQAPGHGASSALDDAASSVAAEHSEAKVSVSPPDAHPGLVDCPVTCSKEAIVDSVPRALRVLGPDVQATRVWCTLCCISVLQRMNVSWIAGDGDIYEEEEKTIVDSGFHWIASQCAEQPALAAALESGAVLKEAHQVTAQWHSAFERRVGDLRRAKGVREEMSRSHVHRAFTSLTRAVMTKHDTLAVFLREPLDGLQRWQMFMIIITLVFSQLMVNIWMYYAKAVNCCADVVSILDAGPDGSNCPAEGSCRSFNGTCADVVQQFAEIPVLPDFPAGLADYTCDAFPMDSKPVDSFIVGLISLAISLPVVMFLQTAFAIANDSEAPESWLEWYGWRKFVFGFNAHRRWHYTGPAGQPNRHVRWFVRSVGAPPTETAINLVHSMAARVTCSEPPWVVEAREAAEENAAAATGHDFPAWGTRPSTGRSCSKKPSHLVSGSVSRRGDGDEPAPSPGDKVKQPHLDRPSGGGSDCSDGSATDEARQLARYNNMLAVVGVYVCWAVFTWFVFTYGMLIYRLLGAQAEHDIARSWGVSYGLNAAAEWKDFLFDAARSIVIVVILERLYLTRTVFWLDEHLDYFCIQAMIFGSELSFIDQIGNFWRNTRRLA